MKKLNFLIIFIAIALLNGCANINPRIHIDKDNDGVVDYKDICHGTPTLAKVDKFGCALDNDHDGVINLYDKCPHTSILGIVNSSGCTIK